MVALILRGVATVIALYPFCAGPRRLKLKRSWSKRMLDILGIQFDADSGQAAPGSLLVANHISWLDIFVINAALPAAFVAKEEVRRWPIIGWLAAMNDTVFLKRGSRAHARLVNESIAKHLAAGKYVAIFPEGTTTDGARLLHFHAALFEPALSAKNPIVPLALSYWEPSGERSLAPRYDGDLSVGDSLKAILAQPRLIARLTALAPLSGEANARRAIADRARNAIGEALGMDC